MSQVFVTGSFDNLRSRHVRFLEAAAKLGEVHVLLWSDETTRTVEGSSPIFKVDERLYLLWSIRYVSRISVVSGQLEDDALTLPHTIHPDPQSVWVVDEVNDTLKKRAYCAQHGIQYVVLKRIPRDGLPRRESTQLREF